MNTFTIANFLLNIWNKIVISFWKRFQNKRMKYSFIIKFLMEYETKIMQFFNDDLIHEWSQNLTLYEKSWKKNTNRYLKHTFKSSSFWICISKEHYHKICMLDVGKFVNCEMFNSVLMKNILDVKKHTKGVFVISSEKIHAMLTFVSL